MTSTQSRLDVGRAMADQARILAELRRRMGQHCAHGVPGAWQALCAIWGDPTKPEVR